MAGSVKKSTMMPMFQMQRASFAAERPKAAWKLKMLANGHNYMCNEGRQTTVAMFNLDQKE